METTNYPARFSDFYKIGEPLGSGGAAVVSSATSREIGIEYAVKIQKYRPDAIASLSEEYRILLDLYGTEGEPVGIPKAYFFGYYNSKSDALVMDRLGYSLYSLAYKFNGLRERTILLLGIDALSILEHVHDKGYIHRDVSPGNMAVGLLDCTALYLIDFGQARPYRQNGKHISLRDGVRLTGTPRFRSINCNFGREVSRRDDLESLGYSLLYLRNLSLPWEGNDARNDRQGNFELGRTKQSTSFEVLCRDAPCLQKYLEQVRSLRFTERPNYKSLRGLFIRALKKMGDGLDPDLEWT